MNEWMPESTNNWRTKEGEAGEEETNQGNGERGLMKS